MKNIVLIITRSFLQLRIEGRRRDTFCDFIKENKAERLSDKGGQRNRIRGKSQIHIHWDKECGGEENYSQTVYTNEEELKKDQLVNEIKSDYIDDLDGLRLLNQIFVFGTVRGLLF